MEFMEGLERLQQLVREENEHTDRLSVVLWQQGDVLVELNWATLDDAAQGQLARKLNRQKSTLQMRFDVARSFPPERRKTQTVPFSAYVQFMRLPEDKRIDMLESREGWTVDLAEAEVRTWLKGNRVKKGGDVMDVVKGAASIAGVGKVTITRKGGALEFEFPKGCIESESKVADFGDRTIVKIVLTEVATLEVA